MLGLQSLLWHELSQAVMLEAVEKTVVFTADDNAERLRLQAGVDLLRVGTRPPAASRASAYDFSAVCRFEFPKRSFPSSETDVHLLYKTSNIVGEPSVRGMQTPLAAPSSPERHPCCLTYTLLIRQCLMYRSVRTAANSAR